MNQFIHAAGDEENPLKVVEVKLRIKMRVEQPLEDWLPEAIEENLDPTADEELLSIRVEGD